MCLFLLGLDGLGFSRKPKTSGNWSTIVWELLMNTATYTTDYGYKRGKHIPKGLSFLTKYIKNITDDHLYKNNEKFIDNIWGISTLVISVRDKELDFEEET